MQQPDFETTHRQIEALCAAFAPEVRHSDWVTLDWDELRALARGGATIAAHTHTHPILSRVPLERARLEIRRSQDLIRREIGYALPIFAYPDGRPLALSDDMLPVLGDEGIKLAFTMIPGRARLRRDNLLRLPRIPVWRTLRLAQFHSHHNPHLLQSGKGYGPTEWDDFARYYD